MYDKVQLPVYARISLDVAARIYNGEFNEGQKIQGRSMLAGEYNVSPETIRRSMNLLEDMDVLSVSQGSGIFIKSKKNAREFIEKFSNKETISSIKHEIKRLIKEKQEIENQINNAIDSIVDYSNKLKNINPLSPVEVDISKGSHIIGKTIEDTKFWQNTGATIVGIRRNGILIISPGPYALFEEGDTIMAIGDTGIYDRITKYIEG